MLTAKCHCGRNTVEIDGELPAQVTRCTCSLCSARGLLHAYYEPEQIRVVDAASDGIYRWNSKQVDHHFCPACGCSLYSDSPAFEPDGSWDGKTRRIGINARIIEGIEAADLPVMVIDGKNLW